MGSLGRSGGGGGGRASPARPSLSQASPRLQPFEQAASLANPSPSKAAQAQQERLSHRARWRAPSWQCLSSRAWPPAAGGSPGSCLPGLLAALRTRHAPSWAAQGGRGRPPMRRLGCSRAAGPQSLSPPHPSPRPAARPDSRARASPARVRQQRGLRHFRHPRVCGRRRWLRGRAVRRPPLPA